MNTLADLKDENGTSLGAYEQTLFEKAAALGISIVIVMARNEQIRTTTNVPNENLPRALIALGNDLRKEIKKHEREERTKLRGNRQGARRRKASKRR